MEILAIMMIGILLALPFAGCVGLSKLIKKHPKTQTVTAIVLCCSVAFGMFGVVAPVYERHFEITSTVQKKWVKTYDSGSSYKMITTNHFNRIVVDQDWVWHKLKKGDKIKFIVIKSKSYFGIDNHSDQKRTKRFSSGIFFYPIGTPKEARVD